MWLEIRFCVRALRNLCGLHIWSCWFFFIQMFKSKLVNDVVFSDDKYLLLMTWLESKIIKLGSFSNRVTVRYWSEKFFQLVFGHLGSKQYFKGYMFIEDLFLIWMIGNGINFSCLAVGYLFRLCGLIMSIMQLQCSSKSVLNSSSNSNYKSILCVG